MTPWNRLPNMTGETLDQSNAHALTIFERVSESNAGIAMRVENKRPLTCGNALRCPSRLACLADSPVSSTSKRLASCAPVSEPSSAVQSLTKFSNCLFSNIPVSSANMQNARRTRRRPESDGPYPCPLSLVYMSPIMAAAFMSTGFSSGCGPAGAPYMKPKCPTLSGSSDRENLDSERSWRSTSRNL